MSVPFGASWFCNLGVNHLKPSPSFNPTPNFLHHLPTPTHNPNFRCVVDPPGSTSSNFTFSKVTSIEADLSNCEPGSADPSTMETRLLRLVRTLSEASRAMEPCQAVWSVGWWRCFFGGGKIHWKVMPGRGGSNPMGLGFWWQMMGMWGGYFSYSYELFDVVTILCTCTVILRVDIWNCLGGPFWKCERFAAQWEYIFHP